MTVGSAGFQRTTCTLSLWCVYERSAWVVCRSHSLIVWSADALASVCLLAGYAGGLGSAGA